MTIAGSGVGGSVSHMRVKDAVGRFGEQVAAEHLQFSGLTILERNWRCRDGELDLVVRDGATLVFVEVKTRSSLAFGSPAEGVNRDKVARIRRLAMLWLGAHQDAEHFWTSIRFDVVGVVRQPSGRPVVRHIEGAF